MQKYQFTITLDKVGNRFEDIPRTMRQCNNSLVPVQPAVRDNELIEVKPVAVKEIPYDGRGGGGGSISDDGGGGGGGSLWEGEALLRDASEADSRCKQRFDEREKCLQQQPQEQRPKTLLGSMFSNVAKAWSSFIDEDEEPSGQMAQQNIRNMRKTTWADLKEMYLKEKFVVTGFDYHCLFLPHTTIHNTSLNGVIGTRWLERVMDVYYGKGEPIVLRCQERKGKWVLVGDPMACYAVFGFINCFSWNDDVDTYHHTYKITKDCKYVDYRGKSYRTDHPLNTDPYNEWNLTRRQERAILDSPVYISFEPFEHERLGAESLDWHIEHNQHWQRPI